MHRSECFNIDVKFLALGLSSRLATPAARVQIPLADEKFLFLNALKSALNNLTKKWARHLPCKKFTVTGKRQLVIYIIFKV